MWNLRTEFEIFNIHNFISNITRSTFVFSTKQIESISTDIEKKLEQKNFL